jgi:hypothetical protein
MNGKEYLLSALEKVGPISSELESSDKVDAELAKGLAQACEVLGSFKNKATLRTKNGATIAIPVFEVAENLETAWEDEDMDDVQEKIEEFLEAVEVFGGALKERTVIMT